MIYGKIPWPSAQHAYQAAKICPTTSAEEAERIRKRILDTTDPGVVKEIGKELKMAEALKDRGNTIELMFRIILCKFSQSIHLARCLLIETGERPIWHVDKDGFWGTARWFSPPAAAVTANPMPSTGQGRSLSFSDGQQSPAAGASCSGGRSASAGASMESGVRLWYAGDNWNGKILSVVRELIRERMKDELGGKVPPLCRNDLSQGVIADPCK